MGCPTNPCYFGFDSPARVCFLCVSGAAGLKVAARLLTNSQRQRQAEKRYRIIVLPPPCFPKFVSGDASESPRTSENGAQGSAGHRMHGFFRWSSKWWPGVIPLVVFWAIAAWTSTAPLEADLATRSTAALKDTVLDKSRIA